MPRARTCVFVTALVLLTTSRPVGSLSRQSGLLHLTSAATGQAETVTSVQFGGGPTRVIMYASPITQEPYYTRRPSDVPGFTVIRRGVCQLPLIEALSKWRNLEGAGHPLIVGFTPGALDPEQRPGSRVQTLLQWFEASYGYEHRERIEKQQERYTARRAELLDRWKSCSGPATCRLSS